MIELTRRLTVLASGLIVAAMSLTACGGSSNSPASTAQSISEANAPSSTQGAAKPEGKITMVGMATSADWNFEESLHKKLKEHFPEYEFVIKGFDAANIDKTLKTMIAAGNAPDFSFYWPNYIANYVNGNMALDLTPYLTENNSEWANTFEEGTLDIGKVDDKIYCVPFRSVYPMLLVNKDVTEKAGVTIPDGFWTWEQFMETNKTIQEKLGGSGIFPFAVRYDWACWLVRNGMLSNWDSGEKSEDFAAGNISFLEPNIVEVFEDTKSLYDSNYVYPGKGAIAAKLDEILSAFQAGRVAMMAEVNSVASADIKNTGLTNIQVASWPVMGSQDILLGGCDGWFIPANAPRKEDSIKVLKYLTGKECMQIIADDGSPVTTKGISSVDPNFSLYSRDTAKITRSEIVTLSAQIMDVVTVKMPADYLNKGKASLENLEAMRKQALEDKK